MSELDLAAIAARVAAATEAYSGIDLRKSLPTKGAIHERFMEVLADVPALLAEVERLTEALRDMTIRADERRVMYDERAVLVTRWHDRAEAAEALVAEKDAEIERLADVAETNTAAYEYAVVERDEARAALAAAGEDHLATERENGDLRAALADVTRERDDLRARVEAHLRRMTLFADGRKDIYSTPPSDDPFNKGIRHAVDDLSRALLDTTATEESEVEA